MLYLLWGLLNILVWIFVLFSFFRVTRLIREKLGLGVVVIFVVGVIALMSYVSNKNKKHQQKDGETQKWNFRDSNAIRSDYKTVVLEKNWLSKYELGVAISIDSSTKAKSPVYANSYTEGISSGTKWQPISIILVSKEGTQEDFYHVHGEVYWSLLGITLIRESKNYVVSVPMK